MDNPYDIAAAFAAIEKELTSSMMRNMERHRVEEIKEKKQWAMWQAVQLKALEQYKRQNRKKFGKRFRELNGRVEQIIRKANDAGGMEQELAILRAIQRGYRFPHLPERVQQILEGLDGAGTAQKIPKLIQMLREGKAEPLAGEFFRLNERKLDALVKATAHDMEKAETAILRMSDDQYRRAVFNAQVYANTGSGTYEKAVDMATKDMLAAGLNCVVYKNGARHTLADYADMALRTAAKRAYLQGEGTKRQEWGISTVIMNKRGNPCPKCLPFCGKILIDDVWSGGSRKDGPYPLMSSAVAAGLYHPRCRDSHTTYFEGISTPPDDKFTKEELSDIRQSTKREAKQQYAKRQADRFGRLAEYSLDADNKKQYQKKEDRWKNVVKSFDSGIMKPEVYRKKEDSRGDFKPVSDKVFENLTIAARKKGAVIIRGTKEAEEHLDKREAAAANLGDVLIFRKEVCISEVLEETHHFEQNLSGMNNDKGEPLRSILNEIEAKQYLLDHAKKYQIPRKEIDLTRKQLEAYQEQLKAYQEGRGRT